ncbi:ABC transporter permease [Hoeflea prorocentri]|uniref:ABC transporter permease subunit n=1 Tax=Hoeflea prorocentri TaxID=1922333 RepID=A0A9X3UIQ0_9HYPH|nr:ABC transporter permease subunit [Hoeflea prorocentri]MCY6382067.1 ABC transporter permease subunit [Hoeflea prorocentri]MDA5399867.1 ABC transporter permease subunit [Hoeflea prorocentri]
MSPRDSADSALENLVSKFAGSNAAYYTRQFSYLSEAPGFRVSFNWMAAIASPVWFGARGLWSWFLMFLLVETFAYIQIFRGLLGNLGQDQLERAEAISRTLATRMEQIAAARESGASSLEALERAAESLQRAYDGALAAAEAASGDAAMLIVVGLVLLLVAKLAAAITANWALETRFTRWRSDPSLASGLSMNRTLAALAIFLCVAGLSAVRFARPDIVPLLLDFPTDKNFRIATADWIKDGFDWAKRSGADFFNAITLGVRSLLDGLEIVFVGTPWPVIMIFVGMLAWLTGGSRVAIFTIAALAYLGILGFWEKAMTTISLLGAAAMVSITLGIPLGILCARRPKLFAVIRPILDFMQSMPSFVYLIPVIAFFGAGKPAAIVATLIFGSPPVVRLTVLGLQQVPATVREAALAFGATPAYLLFKVDLPLAARTIMAGVNQTILMSLAMVVVASLIGAKGLGEDVLEALQFASEGQGILAGLAILFCALILDRIVAGKPQK